MNRTKLLPIGLLAAVPILGWAVAAQAHNGQNHDMTNISEGMVVGKTIFTSGRQIDIRGEIQGDVFCAGQNVTITGRVQGDVICMAQNIRVEGTVDGDVRVAAQNAVIGGTVGGSVSAAAERVRIASDSRIDRDVSAAASDVQVEGTIGRDLQAAGESVYVNGQVGRNVDTQSNRLSLGDNANVAGNIAYTSDQDIRRDQGAQVGGRVDREQRPAEDSRDDGWFDGVRLFALLAMLLTSMLLVMMVPGVFRSVTGTALRSPGRTLLIGLVASIAVPVGIGILMLTVVGLPLGLLALLIWLAILFLAGPFAAYLAGRLVLRRSNWNTNALLIMLTGSMLLLVLYHVPVLSFFVLLAVVWFGVGMMIRSLWPLRRKPQYNTPSAAPATVSAVLAESDESYASDKAASTSAKPKRTKK